ncbi:MAG TPA: LURP-one-related family protein [Ktedonobacterales bacterium]|nr:LURP-one-related family protein [Ktedonobacterales bacterium]
MFRGRREERREERQQEHAMFGRGGNATRYQMRQRLVSIGQDFTIENDRGERVFQVDGKALRVRQTVIFKDARGQELCKIQERMVRVKDTMEIEGPNGETLATVKKAIITPLRDRWTVRISSGPELDIHGNILDHEYDLEVGGHKVAEVSKRWFRVADTYGVEIEPGQNDVLILAATVAVDMMAHQGR